jgi:hypothetical protein
MLAALGHSTDLTASSEQRRQKPLPITLQQVGDRLGIVNCVDDVGEEPGQN